MTELSPQKAAARDLMMREFERIGSRWMQIGDEQLELMRQRQDMEELWRLAGLGNPPPLKPTMPELARSAS